MTVRQQDEPVGATPAGYKAVTVWGPPAQVRQWLEITDGIEWFSRPQPHSSGVVVRVRMRQQLPGSYKSVQAADLDNPYQDRRRATEPWWHRRELVVLAGLAAGMVLGGLALAAWAVVTAVTAVVTWIANNWPLIVAILFVVALAGLLLRKAGGGCKGLHCTGCKYH